MNLSPAKSQKAEDCPISFILDDQSGGDSSPIEKRLFIRPADMTRTYPSRMSVNQTMDGGWIDSFGKGLEQTTISGTLGWRTGPDGKDGLERTIDLRNTIYDTWHRRRADAVARGANPNDVKLVFVDTLNGYAKNVAIQVFEIKRNKSSPLQSFYRISFTAVSNADDLLITLLNAPDGVSATDPSGFGLSSLTSSLNEINGYIASAKSFINSNILAPVTGFMNLSHQVLTAVQSTISNGLSVAVPLINVARSIAQTGVNVFRTLAAVANIPAQIRSTLMQVAAAYSNIFCVLKNSLKTPRSYENYGGLYGASNCSSTFGGSPPSQYAGQNPFYKVVPESTSTTGVSSAASSAMSSIIKSDVVLNPMSNQDMAAKLTAINTGVVF